MRMPILLEATIALTAAHLNFWKAKTEASRENAEDEKAEYYRLQQSLTRVRIKLNKARLTALNKKEHRIYLARKKKRLPPQESD